MQSDPWWSLAMAINVYMVFFLAANPTSFRQYLWVYCLICFGAPAVPALILLTIRNDPRGPVYGNATVSAPPRPSVPRLRCQRRLGHRSPTLSVPLFLTPRLVLLKTALVLDR